MCRAMVIHCVLLKNIEKLISNKKHKLSSGKRTESEKLVSTKRLFTVIRDEIFFPTF